ncbi:MAG: GNAT family N-acetyltransferase [Clostridia bacterium]|nr:GNAT family N-acetyltransferase [Clostridia bacterium]
MEITYKNEKALPCNLLYDIFVAVGWADAAKTTEEMITNFNKPFINSTFVVSAWDGDKLVGCVRALSDKMFRSVIYDLAVLPAYQGQKIGKELVKRCISCCPNSEWLIATIPACVGFYDRLGFKANDSAFLSISCKWF